MSNDGHYTWFPAYMHAPFAKRTMPTIFPVPGIWTFSTVFVYDDRLVFRWGFFKPNYKTITFEEIAYYGSSRLPLDSWLLRNIKYIDAGEKKTIEFCAFANNAGQVDGLVLALKRLLPGKEKVQE